MTESRTSRWKGMGVPAALLLVAMIYGREALNIKAQFDEGLVGPAFLPLLLTAIVVLGLLGILFKQWRLSASVEPDSLEESEAEGLSAEHGKPARVALSVLVYTLMFKLVGYVLATVMLAYALLTLFEYASGQIQRKLAVAVFMTLVFDVLFSVCFSVRLPLLPSVLS